MLLPITPICIRVNIRLTLTEKISIDDTSDIFYLNAFNSMYTCSITHCILLDEQIKIRFKEKRRWKIYRKTNCPSSARR